MNRYGAVVSILSFPILKCMLELIHSPIFSLSLLQHISSLELRQNIYSIKLANAKGSACSFYQVPIDKAPKHHLLGFLFSVGGELCSIRRKIKLESEPKKLDSGISLSLKTLDFFFKSSLILYASSSDSFFCLLCWRRSWNFRKKNRNWQESQAKKLTHKTKRNEIMYAYHWC